jgi:hypothetical protein
MHRLAPWRRGGSGTEAGLPSNAAPGLGYEAGWAAGLAVAVVCLLMAGRVSAVVTFGAGSQVPFTVALFVLPLLYAVPGSRRLLDRYRWLVLAVQAVLTWVPFVVFGARWQVGIGGCWPGWCC